MSTYVYIVDLSTIFFNYFNDFYCVNETGTTVANKFIDAAADYFIEVV